MNVCSMTYTTNAGKVLVATTIVSFIALLVLQRSLRVSRSAMIPVLQNSPTKTFSTQSYHTDPLNTTYSEPDKRQRLPKALIIGFSKCGTAALRTFLTIHPDIVSPVLELRYFTEYYANGVEWYRKQMPLSTAEQMTIEKTPSYIMTNVSLQRIRAFNSSIKLIVIVRDPIVRLQSQYAHVFSHTLEGQMPPFKKWCNEKPRDSRVIHFSDYARYIRQAFNLFHRDQVLVISEDTMERNPLSVLKEVEAFLQLRPAFSNDMFVYNKEKGFYCFNTASKLFPRVLKMVKVNRFSGCLGRDKGRDHPKIDEQFLAHLKEVLRPLTEDLFTLIGKRFQWDNFKRKRNKQ